MDRPSRLFVGYRALGFVSNGVPLCVRYDEKRRENFVVTCVGQAFHTYNCSKLGIVSVSDRLSDDITCLAVDQSFTFAACGKDIYAFSRGKQVLFTYHGHTSDVHLILPFAHHLISVDVTSTVKIWVVREQVELSQLKFDSSQFNITALIHPRGLKNLVLFASRQGRLQLWNVNTSRLLYTFTGWGVAVTALQQSPEEKVVAVGLSDGRTVIHNIEYDETLMTFRQDWGPVTAVSFRTDGEPMVCTGSPAGHIALWDLEKRKLRSEIHAAHNASVTGVQCLPSQPILVTSSPDNAVKMWIFDMADGGARLLRQRSGHSQPPIKLRFHGNDGQVLLSAGEDSTIRCFSTVHDSYNKSLGRASYNKAKTKKSGLQLDEHCMPPVTDFASQTARQSDWDGIVACHRGEVTATTWNFNRSTMGSHRLQHQRFTDDETLRQRSTALCVDVSSCGNYCVIGYSSGHADVFNMQSGLHRGSYASPSTAHSGCVASVNIDALSQLSVTTGADCLVRFWKFKTCQLMNELKMDAAVARTSMHRDSCMLAVSLDNFHVVVIDTDIQRVVRLFTGHSNTVTDMGFSSDGRWLITASVDSTVKTWDLPSGKLVDCFLVTSPVTSLAFSPTSLFLATSHVGDVGVYLWSNTTLFTSMVLSPLPDDFEPSTMELPCTSHACHEREEVEAESMECDDNSMERISDDLVTFSELPASRWKNLLCLDVIRLRNKPREAPKRPKSAPFFLPTVAGLEPKFVDGTSTTQHDDSVTASSRVLPASSKPLMSEFGRLLSNCSQHHNYDVVLDSLKSMGPAAVELELSLLSSSPADTVDDDDDDLIVNFIDFLTYLLSTKRDVDLATSYLGLLLKLHGERLYNSVGLCRCLSRLEQSQMSACQRLIQQTNKVICVSEFIRTAAL